MCHGDTFDDLIAGLSEEHRVIEANTEAARIRWLGRVAMLLPTIRAAEADFRHACIHQGIARHGRTETMLLRMLVPEINTKTAQRWTDCIIFVVDHGAADAETASAMIVAEGGIVKTHEAYRAEHLEMAQFRFDLGETTLTCDLEAVGDPRGDIINDDEEEPDGRLTNFFQPRKRYWLTPSEIYAELDAEFRFDFDPCPFPRPLCFDGLTCPWGRSSYCNPPFVPVDEMNQRGPTAFVYKAIEESRQGKTVMLMLPTEHCVNLLLEAGAEVRSAEHVRWLDTTNREPYPSPPPVTCFILRGDRVAPDRILPSG